MWDRSLWMLVGMSYGLVSGVGQFLSVVEVISNLYLLIAGSSKLPTPP